MASKLYRNLAIAVVFLMAAANLVSCGGNDVTASASEATANRDYNGAMTDILSLDDDEIVGSDSLSQLLSTAYYGLTLKPVEGISVDCYDMDFVPDKDIVVFTDFHNGSLNLYEFSKMKFLRTILLPGEAFNIDISPDGTVIAAAMVDGTIILYDLQTGLRLNTLKGHTSKVRDVAFKDNNLLFSCSNDRSIAAWNVSDGHMCWKKPLNSRNIKSLKLNKDKTRIISASNDGSACVIEASEEKPGEEKLRLVHGSNYVNDAAVSPDDRYIVTVSGDGYAMVWNAVNGSLIKDVFLDDPLCAVDISDDGRHILIGGMHDVYIIDSKDLVLKTKIHGAGKPLRSVMFTGNSDFAFTDNTKIWKCKLLTGSDLIKEARKLSGR